MRLEASGDGLGVAQGSNAIPPSWVYSAELREAGGCLGRRFYEEEGKSTGLEKETPGFLGIVGRSSELVYQLYNGYDNVPSQR